VSVVAAFLLPGSPLPWFERTNPPWVDLADAMEAAGHNLAAAEPDVVLVYSTQWIAVLDQLWQTRPHLRGVHVDPNWHEYGELAFDLRIDVPFAEQCCRVANARGIKSRPVDYDAFPVDTGTIVAARGLDPGGKHRFALTSNNLYHDAERTAHIAEVAREVAAEEGKRLAVVGVGGLSGNYFRDAIKVEGDRVASAADERWNRRVLAWIEAGAVGELRAAWGEYVGAARVDMGFKHFAFVLGALGGDYRRAEVMAYGPLYGTGAAVIRFQPENS